LSKLRNFFTDCLQILKQRSIRVGACFHICIVHVAHLTHIKTCNMYVVRGHMRVIPLQTTAITLPCVGRTSNYARVRLPNHSHLRHVQAAHCTITLQRSSPLHSHAANCIRTFVHHTSTYYYPHKPSIPICACFNTPTTYTSHLSPVK
jgi:hypothetical protein